MSLALYTRKKCPLLTHSYSLTHLIWDSSVKYCLFVIRASYNNVGIVIQHTCGKDMYHHIISFREERLGSIKILLHIIKMHAPSYDNERVFLCFCDFPTGLEKCVDDVVFFVSHLNSQYPRLPNCIFAEFYFLNYFPVLYLIYFLYSQTNYIFV